MKTALWMVLCAAGLAGCVAVPVPAGPPRVYAAPPPPVVVVRPYPYRYGWHRRWY